MYKVKVFPDEHCTISNDTETYSAGKNYKWAEALVKQLNTCHRPNVIEMEDGLYVCWNNHEKEDDCEYEKEINYE